MHNWASRKSDMFICRKKPPAQVNKSVHGRRGWSREPERRKRNYASGYSFFFFLFLQIHRQTTLVPESQICQRCAGRSCRFPVALVSRRSYSQSTQTHHSRHPLHSPGSAGSQLERENRLGEGLYHLSTADTAADCYRRVGNDKARKAQLHLNTDCCANHKAEPFPLAQAVFRVFMT